MQTYRALDHGTAKNQCSRILAPAKGQPGQNTQAFTSGIADFAESFVIMQGLRRWKHRFPNQTYIPCPRDPSSRAMTGEDRHVFHIPRVRAAQRGGKYRLRRASHHHVEEPWHFSKQQEFNPEMQQEQ